MHAFLQESNGAITTENRSRAEPTDASPMAAGVPVPKVYPADRAPA
jgi:hypothetical protein